MADRVSCSCLCGAVRYHVRIDTDRVKACHCRMCQKWAGGISLAIDCDPQIEIADETHVGIYQSSDWGERVFCTRCGSPLFWRMRDGSFANLPPSAIDDARDFALSTEYCIDRKPGYYSLEGDTERLTEAEMVALYSEPSEHSHG